MIRKEKPDRVIHLGDHGTFDSVSGHALKGSEADKVAPRIKEDLQVCREALEIMDASGGSYAPEKHILEGNHEYRLERWMSENPAAKGVIRFADIPEDLGWKVYPYRHVLVLNRHKAIKACHAVMNGVNKPLEGKSATQTIAQQAEGVTFHGHIHKFVVATHATVGGGKPRMAISVPCFMENGHIEGYAKGSACDWEYGVLRCFTHSKRSRPDIEFVSTVRLKEKYG